MAMGVAAGVAMGVAAAVAAGVAVAVIASSAQVLMGRGGTNWQIALHVCALHCHGDSGSSTMEVCVRLWVARFCIWLKRPVLRLLQYAVERQWRRPQVTRALGSIHVFWTVSSYVMLVCNRRSCALTRPSFSNPWRAHVLMAPALGTMPTLHDTTPFTMYWIYTRHKALNCTVTCHCCSCDATVAALFISYPD